MCGWWYWNCLTSTKLSPLRSRNSWLANTILIQTFSPITALEEVANFSAIQPPTLHIRNRTPQVLARLVDIKFCTSQVLLQLVVIMWLDSGQWNVSRREVEVMSVIYVSDPSLLFSSTFSPPGNEKMEQPIRPCEWEAEASHISPLYGENKTKTKPASTVGSRKT